MTTLSNVQLAGGLLWTDRWGVQRVAQQMVRTLGGSPVFYYAQLHAGVSVTLESLADQGWQELGIVEALYDLSIVAGAQYLLDLGATQFSVMFRHDDGPAFEATPMIPRTIAQPGDYFSIKLKLVTV